MTFSFDPKIAFGANAGIYNTIRPPYLPAQIKRVMQKIGVGSDDCVADIGAGTGKLTQAVAGICQVYCVEPDPRMRKVCQHTLSSLGHHFEMIDGVAEKTNLPNQSVNCIIMGDAAHWFDPNATHEFKRIIRPGGHIAVFARYSDSKSPMIKLWDKLLNEHCLAYRQCTVDKLIKTDEARSIRNGQHLVSEKAGEHDIDVESMTLMWSPDDMYAHLQSRSGVSPWVDANRDVVYEKVIHPIFATYALNSVLSVPYLSHVLMGKVREYSKDRQGQQNKDLPRTYL